MDIQKTKSYLSLLTIAGSDSGGGAGIQADLKTFSALGCFGTSAITAITVQNTQGVHDIHAVPLSIIEGQIRAVMEDIPPKAIKIGMVDRPEVAQIIAKCLQDYASVPVVFDPVMVASSGDRLIQEEAIASLKEFLFPIATLVTPNLDEAGLLANMDINNKDQMEAAGNKILAQNCQAVLVKGGHLSGEKRLDLLIQKDQPVHVFEGKYIPTTNVHGTGCTLSSAIATWLAQGLDLTDATQMAWQYIRQALQSGATVQTGKGAGPLNHFFQPKPLIQNELV